MTPSAAGVKGIGEEPAGERLLGRTQLFMKYGIDCHCQTGNTAFAIRALANPLQRVPDRLERIVARSFAAARIPVNQPMRCARKARSPPA
jgi:hypothetical protein